MGDKDRHNTSGKERTSTNAERHICMVYIKGGSEGGPPARDMRQDVLRERDGTVTLAVQHYEKGGSRKCGEVACDR